MRFDLFLQSHRNTSQSKLGGVSIRLLKKQRRLPAKQNLLELLQRLPQRQHQRSLECRRLLEEVLPRLYSVEPPHLQGEDSRRREIRPVHGRGAAASATSARGAASRPPTSSSRAVSRGASQQHHGLELLPAGVVGLP